MPSSLPGCSFCFQGHLAASPDGGEPWCACEACDRRYHARCWQQVGACCGCGASTCKDAPPPPPRRWTTRRTKAIPIVPAGVIHVRDVAYAAEYREPGASRRLIVRSLGRLGALLPAARALFAAGLLLLIAAALGSYVFRIATLAPFSVERAMNAVFREAAPAHVVLLGALMAAGLAAWTAFPHPHDERPAGWRGLRALGALIALLLVDALLILLDNRTTLAPLALPPFVPELLWAQGAATLFAALLAPLYRRIVAPAGPLLPQGLPVWARLLLHGARFCAVALAICVLVTLLVVAATSLLYAPGTVVRAETLRNEPLQTLFVGGLLVGLAVSALCFWPPQQRNLPSLPLLRLVTLVGALLLVGMLYRSTGYSQGELFLASLGAVAAVLVCSVPLQRALS